MSGVDASMKSAIGSRCSDSFSLLVSPPYSELLSFGRSGGEALFIGCAPHLSSLVARQSSSPAVWSLCHRRWSVLGPPADREGDSMSPSIPLIGPCQWPPKT